MNWVAIDNGISGFIGIVDDTGKMKDFFHTPVFKDLQYTKVKAWVNRIDTQVLSAYLQAYKDDCKVAIERPLVNPGRFKATASALRALEATLIVLEGNKMPYQFIDSKEWQKVMLPSGLEGPELKEASTYVCKRLFPDAQIKKDGDGDALLIAEYLRRRNAGKAL